MGRFFSVKKGARLHRSSHLDIDDSLCFFSDNVGKGFAGIVYIQMAVVVGSLQCVSAGSIGIAMRGTCKKHDCGSLYGLVMLVGDYTCKLIFVNHRDVIVAHLSLDNLDRVLAGETWSGYYQHPCGE